MKKGTTESEFPVYYFWPEVTLKSAPSKAGKLPVENLQSYWLDHPEYRV